MASSPSVVGKSLYQATATWRTNACVTHGCLCHEGGVPKGGAEIPLTAVATPARHFQELAGTARVMVDMSIFQTAA